MPVPAVIADAAAEFHNNTGLVERVAAGIEPSQWLSRPNEHSNHFLWVAGHMLWARQGVTRFLGAQWQHPGLEVFARSSKIDSSLVYPSPDQLLAAWKESDIALSRLFETITAEALDAPAPPRPPSPNGKLSGLVGVLAWHETYHLGQLSYLRGWLGYPGLFG